MDEFFLLQKYMIYFVDRWPNKRKSFEQWKFKNKPHQLILEALRKKKEKCYYCEEKLDRYTKDHIIPRCRGGSKIEDNIVYACKRCNTLKDNMTIGEFLNVLFVEFTSPGKFSLKYSLTKETIKKMIINISKLKSLS